ncbi:hypothetical protein KY284_012689 [Solanum tuberosum]|nr:hypothetical protein KY284_012689 [Solanum tuberosum]
MYARCSALERLELWEDIGFAASTTNCPWVVEEDFNTITDEVEKLSGLLVTYSEIMDFTYCISECALNELNVLGSSYTWWNGRIEEDIIFKRLDRLLGNNESMNLLLDSEVTHLIRHGSDYAPFHAVCNSTYNKISKPFRFLNLWTKHNDFLKLVEECWKMECSGSTFMILHTKLKRVRTILVEWNRKTFGNIFQKIATMEDVIKAKEAQLEVSPTSTNREELSKANAELKNYLNIEEEFLKQKVGMAWFKDGDSNTKFIHDYVKGRRRKLQI